MRGRRKAKIFYLVIFVLLGSIGSVFSVVGYQAASARYHSSMLMAQKGEQHLKTAESLLVALPQHSFDVHAVSQARREFVAAQTIFVQLNDDLKSLPGLSTLIPVYGSRLQTAYHLVSLAMSVSQAGVAGCDVLNMLIERFHDPLQTQQQGLTPADFTFIEHNVHQIDAAFKIAVNEVQQVQPADVQFQPGIGKTLEAFRSNIPTFQQWLRDVEDLLPVVPTLLGIGAPANYLIEVLDSTELRPGGGFIGNYGIATFSGGRLGDAHITDVDLLDRPSEAAGRRIPLPPAYSWFDLVRSWSFRDSNLDADFPTAARYGELNYTREGGSVPVQGVIAITPALIQHALEITGPIDIPEYHEAITAQNLIDRIHYHQLGPAGEGPDYIPSPDGHSSLRKRFTELLAEHFLAHVRQLPASALPQFFQLAFRSLHSKDIQVYFNSSVAEEVLGQYHLDGAIQSPTGDSFFVVDANISPNKANSFISNTLDDQVTIDTQGNAIHHTTISYAWTQPGQNYGHSLYRDYVRVYVPSGSLLQTQDGWQPRGTSQSFGCEVWAGFFTLLYGQTRTITLVWTVPHAARHDTSSWHYQYLIQRQAGAQRALQVQITLPSCAAVTNTSESMVIRGNQSSLVTQSMDQDARLNLDYRC